MLTLFAFVPIVLAAAQLGTGAAIGVGLTSGWVSGAYDSGRLLQVFEIGMFGLLASLLLYQDYKGRLGQILRQPLIAVPWAGVTTWLLSCFSIYAYADQDLSTLSAVSQSATIAIANLPVITIKSAIAGEFCRPCTRFGPACAPSARPPTFLPMPAASACVFCFSSFLRLRSPWLYSSTQ